MGYLHPPPGNTPVVVVRDFGGDVRQYAAQTNAYIRSGREVRLHECRSACTLALAAPNVCVYPNSVLRFHKAYNPFTRATNDDVSQEMMRAYPPAVRARLGALTRQYKSLTGSELIRLGVRDCNAPARQRIIVARANAQPAGSANRFTNAFGTLTAGFGATDIPAYRGYNAPVRVARVRVQSAQAADAARGGDMTVAVAESPRYVEAPAPPPRPQELSGTPEPAAARADAAARVASPPQRPLAPVAPQAHAPAWAAPIRGSAPVLASARFAPFPYRLIRKS